MSEIIPSDKLKYLALTAFGVSLATILLERIKSKEKRRISGFIKRNMSVEPTFHTLATRKYNRLQLLKSEKEGDKTSTLVDELKFLDQPSCEIMSVNHLIWILDQEKLPYIQNPMIGDQKQRKVEGGGHMKEDMFVFYNSFVLSNCSFGPQLQMEEAQKWLRAGPRQHIYFKPNEVKAIILTCGPLAPGMNTVIRELVMVLHYSYQVKEVYGSKQGFLGIKNCDFDRLRPEDIKTSHHYGGSILQTDHCSVNPVQIVQNLQQNGFNQIYMIGDLESHYFLQDISREITKQKLKIACCGIPVCTDNEFPIIDYAVGFTTAIENAQLALKTASIESNSYNFGCSVVRLSGLNSGYLAIQASLASREVNICLVPEFKFEMNGNNGVLEYISQRILKRSHVVVMVAEGASYSILDEDIPDPGTDLLGNPVYPDIGKYMCDRIAQYCYSEKKMKVNVRYIDPTYMVRSSPANSLDSKLAEQLAANSVHGLIAGFTNFCIGHVNNKSVMIPLQEIISGKYPSHIMPNDRMWQRLLASTGQPSFVTEEGKLIADSPMKPKKF